MLTTNGKQNRRMIVTVAIILAVAFAGLFMVNVRPAGASRSSVSPSVTGVTAGPGEAQAVPERGDAGMGGAIVKMISALAVVIASVFGGLYLLRRLMNRKGSKTGRQDILDVVQTTYIGPRKTISLVKVGSRSVLVGVTETQISTLTELTEEETAELLVGTAEKAAPDPFAGFLTRATAALRQMGAKREHTALEA